MRSIRHVAVVGAGAFGGWTALHLQRSGVRVTLLDAWGPGNARASSGGDTRIIRSAYGGDASYTEMAVRALQQWREWRSAGESFFQPTGVLWMSADGDSLAQRSLPVLRGLNLDVEEIAPAAAARRWPQIDFDGIRHVLLEPDGGYLFARRACDAVAREVVRLGGSYRQAAVASVARDGSRPLVRLSDGTRLDADCYVFACGPWLGRIFPDVLGDRIRATRQEVFYLGTPAGDERFLDAHLPVWADLADRFVYGVPGNAHRGFKVSDDTRGPAFDPTDGSRLPSDEGLGIVRAVVQRRFPLLRDAPVLGAEVCQYEMTPDGHFVVDRHPAMPDVWIAGGGSGHGFKMGPALGEMLAGCVRGETTPDARFALARFDLRT